MTTRHSGRPAAGRSGRRDVALRTAVLLTLALTPLGCTTNADAADDSASGDIDAASAAPAAEPVPISSFNEATYTSLVADRAGALHAVWLDRNPETQRQAVYHRSSSDDGRSWGNPTFLSEGQPDGYTGIPRVVSDNAGRVYAVWKMVDRGTSMAEQELLSRPAYGTLVYRVLVDGRWSPVRTLGAERAVVAWFAATDPRGRSHVVWSENPDGAGFLSTTADAGTLRQAHLDGATPRGGQVISGASRFGKLGYWSISGYVDANGTAHWVALRGNDSDRRTILVHSSSGRERTLPWFKATTQATGARTPPQLVLDASGMEHVVVHEGGARPGVVDHVLNAERYPDTVVTGVDADAIQDFQLSSAGGRPLVTIQITGDDGNRLADLYLSTWNGDGWTTPARVTDNARSVRARGVTDARARSVGTVKVGSAIHASVVPTRSGALHVLLTNRETSRHVDTRAGGMSGASARSRAWFMTVPGAVAAGAGGVGGRTPVPTPAEQEPEPDAGARRVGVTAAPAAEQLFARYDVTEDGWLSGTELNACGCRSADANRDGEVTKSEFLAAARGRGDATRGVAGDASRADATREAERLFARYDITEGGWLSGTELSACDCRGDDANGDGEVTKAEFVAGFVRREGSSPASTSTRSPTPSRPAPSPSTPVNPPNLDAEPTPATGSGTTGDVARGKYNCYANGAGRPMPWEPGFGGVREAPRATTQYLMNLTVGENGNYQYLNRGRGSLRLNGRTGMIEWLSGPFAGSGIRAAYASRGDGRPVIYLELEGTRAHCVGPQQ
jgi:hypothetical protein